MAIGFMYLYQVRKTVAILFTALYLFGATEASQLFKLPVLIQHYYEHKANNASVTLYAFLQMHYLGNDNDDTDNMRDQALPFKTMDDCCVMASTSLPPQKLQIIHIACKDIQQEFTLLNDPSRFFISPEDIFQPPRII
jgi:hypothetical protein